MFWEVENMSNPELLSTDSEFELDHSFTEVYAWNYTESKIHVIKVFSCLFSAYHKFVGFYTVTLHSLACIYFISGFGRTGWQVFLVSALIMLAVINETMGISILIPASHCDLNLSATDKGVLTGVSFAGECI